MFGFGYGYGYRRNRAFRRGMSYGRRSVGKVPYGWRHKLYTYKKVVQLASKHLKKGAGKGGVRHPSLKNRTHLMGPMMKGGQFYLDELSKTTQSSMRTKAKGAHAVEQAAAQAAAKAQTSATAAHSTTSSHAGNVASTINHIVNSPIAQAVEASNPIAGLAGAAISAMTSPHSSLAKRSAPSRSTSAARRVKL